MYENLIDPQIQVLERCQVAWDNMMPNLPDDLSPYVPSLTKQAVKKSFSMLIERLNSIKLQSEEQVSPFVIQTIAQNFSSWTTPIEAWIASAPANVPSIYSHLNTMWSQLNAFDVESNTPSIDEIKKLIIGIKGSQLEANNLVKSMSDIVSEFEGKRDTVLIQCNEIVVKATDSLAAAARKGLAVSFEQRAAEYDEPREGWLFGFLISLAAIVAIAALYILPEIKKITGVDRLYYILTDAPLILPFIWLAWFSALRFSQLGRLKEDYKFKVATALALDGYRKQAEGLSKELEEKLLDLAIANFGENPLRLMTKESAKDAHPLAGVLDEKTVVELIRERVKAVLGGKSE